MGINTDMLIRRIASGKGTPEEIETFRNLVASGDAEEYNNLISKFLWYGSQQPAAQDNRWHDQELLDILLNKINSDQVTGEVTMEVEAGSNGMATNAGPVIQSGNVVEYDQPVHELSQPVRGIGFHRMRWLKYAAMFIFILGLAAAYFLTKRVEPGQTIVVEKEKEQPDIAPGENKAMLTLADGTTIMLDDAGNGVLAQQGNVNVMKLANGEIAYNLDGTAGGEVIMNTMSTPRGGQYRLTLPDGTKVWLNAASSITYPVIFVGRERKVKITGELYFEVAKNKEHPFIVDADGKSLVEVLGTHFNVNSYAGEDQIRTTLLEGSVRVSAAAVTEGRQVAILKPGQQARQDREKESLVVGDADIENVMAWKNGFFSLQNARFEDVVKELERWYDVEVKYEGKMPAIKFQGKMDRGVHLSGVLRWFSKLGIQSELEGRTLILRADQ